MQMIITLPLFVYYGKKKFILNLNNYRNLHYRSLNAAKVSYKEAIWHSIPDISFTSPVELTYTYYHGTRAKVDISNPCSVIDKFTCDALVSKGLMPDDNCDHLKRVTYIWGGYDKNNPRCELKINEINS